MTPTTTVADAKDQILSQLLTWASIGTIARKLGIPRSTVEREVANLRAAGKLEARRNVFWRKGGARVGFDYRVAVVDCGPSGFVLNAAELAQERLEVLFTCHHGIEMCPGCTVQGRRCADRCVECSGAAGVFA